KDGAPLMEALDGIPPEVSRLAASTVREGPRGIRTIDPERMRAAVPPDGTEGYVSPSALQLALAAAKPGMSRVWNEDEANDLLRSFGDQPRTYEKRIQQMRAKLAMERAMRTLERMRWVRWYGRQS